MRYDLFINLANFNHYIYLIIYNAKYNYYHIKESNTETALTTELNSCKL